MKRLFGTDGIRGRLSDGLDPFLAFKVGHASAKELSHGEAGRKALIACDTRHSSSALTYALASGICTAGCDAHICGVVPTPALAHAVSCGGYLFGVMVSASHNGAQYNGIKLLSADGAKLSDEIEERIERRIFEFGTMSNDGLDDFGIGRIERREDVARDYVMRLRQCFLNSLGSSSTITVAERLRVGIDCANGAVSALAEDIFSGLGFDCIFINREPNGKNINLGCGSTDLSSLSALVCDESLDLGLAFDGDGDRCLAVDRNGQPVDGDEIITVLLEDAIRRGNVGCECVVGTVMSNAGLERACRKSGVRLVLADVGDRYVKEEMERNDACIGGEPSGHVIIRGLSSTGDGPLTALMLLSCVMRSGSGIDELAASFERVPVFDHNVPIDPSLRSRFKEDMEIAALCDEVRHALGNDSRLVVRVSGTEPCIRLHVETHDHLGAKRAIKRLSHAIGESYGAKTVQN